LQVSAGGALESLIEPLFLFHRQSRDQLDHVKKYDFSTALAGQLLSRLQGRTMSFRQIQGKHYSPKHRHAP
jgi:hypothetical protein